MVCLGIKPGATGWKAHMNPLSFGGSPIPSSVLTDAPPTSLPGSHRCPNTERFCKIYSTFVTLVSLRFARLRISEQILAKMNKLFIYVTDDRPYMMTLDLIRPFRSYMVRPYMV